MNETVQSSVNKSEFYEKVSSYIDKPNNNFTSPLSEQKYNEIIREVKASLSRKTNNEKLTSLDYRRLNRFEILSIGGIEKLVQKRNDGSDIIRYYIQVSELYNILEKAHQETGHKRTLGMEKEVNKRYCNISRNIIDEYLKLCLQCQLKKKLKKKGLVTKPLLTNQFNKRGQVDLIDMQSEKDGEFKFILNYQDHLTKFLFLRPLKTKRAEEVAYNLMDIFCIIGAPCLLHSDNGREFVNAVITSLADMFEAKIVHGKPRHSESQGSVVERANQDVRDILVAWMNENNTTKWSEGLRFVQMKKNRSYHKGIQRTPYEALFGTSMVNGLKDSDLPLEIVEKLQGEEDVEQMLLSNENMENTVTNPKESFNVEPENEANEEAFPITEDNIVPTKQTETGDSREDNNCDGPTEHLNADLQFEKGDSDNNLKSIEDVENIRKLNAQTSLIEKNRTSSAHGLKRQADRMLNYSANKFPLVTVGQNVIIKIPDEDRGRAAPRNIMAIVISEEDGFYKLGTANGVLEKLYARNEFQLSQSEFISAEDIPSTSFSMRQIAAKETRSKQGFIKCNCKKQCQNKRCQCVLSSIKCNSKCHGSSSCCNK